ncbi:ABC transporter ATP-binding protein [Bradyrhizobium japonicum]|uniref:ABC transporter ATP-binding protein n=1 Tax=Bradyrhizobium japonicum TaxID=375 RepID=UPI00041AC119|nr:ABC transporter ATP-binding protein [Bradyrhizobium japonicum]MCP1740150.1 branched-chain amino acid transport system ATP-binding protein [Bradyrhizobium japonicum]MCP1857826.1 branched-chain amino acid transport system ATP-binding protein [Bradyrhizobium japonicum]MCP1888640.1 branched-chain amino acid transport system ATP-binding protein [Bradyrhizobium japonicum]MCW2321615.1 branched-chain amino acid transport system ATP-binding protein [Bradyrhizobium japonicum]WLB94355.1 ABC transporte
MTDALITVDNLRVGYGGRVVLDNVCLEIRRNEVLCLVGHNGAGKSTLLNALFGVVSRQGGEISDDGQRLHQPEPKKMAALGIGLVPEGRGIFPGLTVDEIFRLAMWATDVPQRAQPERIEWVMSILPRIKTFYARRAGTLSGGQQQMVSIARALLSRPRCLLMDEPSIGLAPKLFQDLLQPIRQLQQQLGLSILLVEQNVKEAFKISDRVLVMRSGAIIHETCPDALADNKVLMQFY